MGRGLLYVCPWGKPNDKDVTLCVFPNGVFNVQCDFWDYNLPFGQGIISEQLRFLALFRNVIVSYGDKPASPFRHVRLPQRNLRRLARKPVRPKASLF